MDSNEAAFRIKPAADISKRVRKIGQIGAQSRLVHKAARNDQEQIAILVQQVDELATAVAALAGYIAARDDIKLED